MKYILALDQGTTSSRTIVFNEKGEATASANQEFEQVYPKPGWVEHNPYDILNSQIETMHNAVNKSGISVGDIAAIGITNQRETALVWDKNTGEPVYNAIVWQCRRTAPICERLEEEGLKQYIKETTGLVLDAYFSGTKISWILDNVDRARQKAENGDLLFGTVDTWLIWNLTGGHIHATDFSNASRTMLYDIHNLCWDKKLLEALNIPLSMMPEVKNSSDDFGCIKKDYFGREIPIYGVAGDQHAALFGQGCFEPGMVKNTYGTGCFMLMNTGEKAVSSKNNLLTTIAWGIDGKITYALEGSVFVAGAAIQWLRDELKMISTAAESEELALSVDDTGGVFLVPAFTGLGAPWWDMYARGTLVGMTRGTRREHIVRAALESIALQSYDLIDAMKHDSDTNIKMLKVDGGASANAFLMQFQSNIMNVLVQRPKCIETTALGAAYFAALKAGIYNSLEEIVQNWECGAEFSPSLDSSQRQATIKGWHKALDRAKNWANEE
jgi:glycerol kinase